jgi:MFS family permease
VFPIVALGVVALPISITGSAFAIPDIADDLGSRSFLLQGVLNGFNFALGLTTIGWGVVSDRIGPVAAASSLGVLDAGRVAAGVAGAAVLTGGSAILSNAFAPDVSVTAQDGYNRLRAEPQQACRRSAARAVGGGRATLGLRVSRCLWDVN